MTHVIYIHPVVQIDWLPIQHTQDPFTTRLPPGHAPSPPIPSDSLHLLNLPLITTHQPTGILNT